MAKQHLREFQGVRTTEPVSGPDVFDVSLIHHLPVGQVGTVIDAYSDGACEVEFILGERGPDGIIEYPQYCQIVLEQHQLELVD